MKKIPTIFDRDWDGDKKVRNNKLVEIPEGAIATKKIDGTNIRVTVRKGTVVRVEKRRNPSKLQKAKGIVEPWYVDADRNDTQDKYIFSAVDNREYHHIPDGEWSGEAYGEHIQGNPMRIDGQRLMLFSLSEYEELDNTPTDFDGLREYVSQLDCEGIVWHLNGEYIGKIKKKDFK